MFNNFKSNKRFNTYPNITKVFMMVLVFSIVSIFSNRANANDFSIKFENIDGTSETFNINDLSRIDFNSLTKPYVFKIYSKSSGLNEHNTSDYHGVNLTQMGFQLQKKVGVEFSNYFFANIDSMAFVPYIENNYKLQELVLDEVLLTGLDNPWSLAFIDEFNVLFTEKSGKLNHYNLYTKIKTEIKDLPAIADYGQGGLLDVKLHPKFMSNFVIFLSHAVADGNRQTTAVTRAVINLEDMKLENKQEIFRALPLVNSSVHFGSRISFDKDGNLFVSVGDRGNPNNAQDSTIHAGKIMRITEFGEVPSDNPFVNSSKARKEIWSMGHRNIQGMDTHPITGELWAHEHGPQGGDELNKIVKGANYAWPLATFGINYNGTEITKDTTYSGCLDPITYWKPSIAPCGMAFVRDNKMPNEADILVGALAGQRITRLYLKDDKVVESLNSMMNYARIRDVKQSPNGKIYAVTETGGRLISLKPKQ